MRSSKNKQKKETVQVGCRIPKEYYNIILMCSESEQRTQAQMVRIFIQEGMKARGLKL